MPSCNSNLVLEWSLLEHRINFGSPGKTFSTKCQLSSLSTQSLPLHSIIEHRCCKKSETPPITIASVYGIGGSVLLIFFGQGSFHLHNAILFLLCSNPVFYTIHSHVDISIACLSKNLKTHCLEKERKAFAGSLSSLFQSLWCLGHPTLKIPLVFRLSLKPHWRERLW